MNDNKKIIEDRRNIMTRQKRLALAPGPQRLAMKLQMLSHDPEFVKTLSKLIDYQSDQLSDDLHNLYDYIIFLEANFLSPYDEHSEDSR